jgi:hypothetical protein
VTLERVRLASASFLRTTTPALSDAEGRTVRELRRVGKRIVIGLEGDLWLVLHLTIAGRLHWKPAHAALRGRQNLAAFDFLAGSLTLAEAGAKRRASLFEAGADGFPHRQWRRERVLGRDSPRGPALASGFDPQVDAGGMGPPVQRDARAVPGEGHGVSRGHGGAWEVRGSVPAVRREDSPDSLRGRRNELLGADWPRTLDELEELRRH